MRIPIRLAFLWIATLPATIAAGVEDGAEIEAGRPAAAEGWKVEPVALPSRLGSPSAVVSGRDGSLFVGWNPSPPTAEPSASVLVLDKGAWRVFADRLESVNGLERIGETLYVVHPPFVSAFRDADGVGRSESRVDLISGLGAPAVGDPIDDHSGGGIRRGVDGFLYIAVGDRGVPRGTGKDGAAIRMQSGGVVRVRPDGTGLEVVSTGDDRTTGLLLSAADDVFTFGGGDDRKRWAKSLVHHVSSGRYGYPYQFLTAPFRTLPVLAKLGDGRAGQGVCYNEEGLPESYQGNLILCDPDAQTVYRLEIRKGGGSFALAKRTPLVTKGTAADFHPYGLATQADQAGFWLVDQAMSRDPVRASSTGRLYRLTYQGPDRRPTTPPPGKGGLADRIKALDHPALSVRLDAEDDLVTSGAAAVSPLTARLNGPEPAVGRIHALWTLDRIGTPEARAAIRSVLVDASAPVRLQAARSCGLRRDREAGEALAGLVHDRDPAVRREAAVGLGRLGDRSTAPALLTALGDADRLAAWTVRQALLAVGVDDQEGLVAAFLDPRRREAGLLLADESWSVPIVSALVEALAKTSEPAVRGRMLTCLAGQFRRYPEWSGAWFGPDPLAGPLPKKTESWTPEGMAAVVRGLGIGLKDADASVRYQAILGLQTVGAPAAPLLRDALPAERDADNQVALVEALGALNDAASTRLLLPVVVDPERPEAVRASALDSLNRLRGRDVVRARLTVLYDEKAPDALVARALPALARDGFLPANDLAGFLENKSPLVRAAAVMSFNPSRPLPPEVKEVVLARLDDADADVRRAAFLAAGPLRLQEAVPKLIEKAKTAQAEDRPSVLHALCALPDPRALTFYLAALDDPDPSLNRAGVRALLAIRDQAEAEIRKARQAGPTPAAALALDRVLGRFEPIRVWRVLGPLPRPAVGLIARDGSIDAARSYSGAGGTPVDWKPFESRDESGRVDLLPLLGESPQPSLSRQPSSPVATAYAELTSADARRAIVLIHSTGPCDIFVNGVPIDAEAVSRDHFTVPLVRGVNRFLVTTQPGQAGWQFECLVSTTDDPDPRPASGPE
ncbi:MAG: HEAT repeat domain-containing protein [Paludisphaera borealis]|uniref:HEAT repeat domain-containing protein n=1 Tax=Paludisphaera borealis TaxID=1387353 RepID=UPI0028473D72|nr:HEAT repeat domain-containing protein [Paludisphaera borealis]MDR3618168.1 HEAT repeat domain-containing protein [Paludisphaera borealis]